MTEIINQVTAFRPSLLTMVPGEEAHVAWRKGSYQGYKSAASDLKKEGKGIWHVSCKDGDPDITIVREA